MAFRFQRRQLILLITILLIIIFTFINTRNMSIRDTDTITKTDTIISEEQKLKINSIKTVANQSIPKANVKVFDLNQPLEPSNVYNDVKCRISAKLYVKTTLCVHDLERDVFVSGSIWKEGMWERWILEPFLNQVNKYPDWLVLDIGGQVGQFSLYAAKMGRKVLTVEPFYDNIIRIHKASTEAKLQNKIKLIQNALSNKRNEIKRLNPVYNNIGGQSLLENKLKTFNRDPSDRYLVETIYFDDIVDSLPKNEQGQDFTNAIMKIDIEGFEPFAFVHAQKLFSKLNINIIFMEWMHIPKQTDEVVTIEKMLELLFGNKLIPYIGNTVLNRENWRQWPNDIVWRKLGF